MWRNDSNTETSTQSELERKIARDFGDCFYYRYLYRHNKKFIY